MNVYMFKELKTNKKCLNMFIEVLLFIITNR